MAIIAPFLIDFGVHFAFIILILIVSYYYMYQKDPLNTEPTHSKSDQTEGMKDVTEDFDVDDEVAPALPDDLQHVHYKGPDLSEEEMIEKSKEFLELIKLRRSVRFYSDKKIPDQVIENIIEAAATSPSGAHTEPWTYVVVNNPLVIGFLKESKKFFFLRLLIQNTKKKSVKSSRQRNE